MNELLLKQRPILAWVPEVYFEAFYDEAMECYDYANQETQNVVVHDMVNYFHKDLILRIGSYHYTGGQNHKFFIGQVMSQEINKMGSTMSKLTQKFEDDCFFSMCDFFAFYNMTYFALDDPEFIREKMLHYNKEVW